jgi:hypothetical protein
LPGTAFRPTDSLNDLLTHLIRRRNQPGIDLNVDVCDLGAA